MFKLNTICSYAIFSFLEKITLIFCLRLSFFINRINMASHFSVSCKQVILRACETSSLEQFS